MHIPYEYAETDLYSRHAALREAQLNGTAYLKRERKASPIRRLFAIRPRFRAAQPRYTPAHGRR